MKGKATELVVCPSQTGGNFSRHFDAAVGEERIQKQGYLQMKVPGHVRSFCSRTILEYEALLVYFNLAEEVTKPGYLDTLKAQVRDGLWGPRYHMHPVVQRKLDVPVLPVSIYLDAVAFGVRDAALGIWLQDISSGQRHLLVCLRKRWQCRCGCQGWCSNYAAFAFVAWLLEAMQLGEYPKFQPDGTPWPADSRDAGVAGIALGFAVAPMFLKGDWAEFSHRLGLTSWAHASCPCFSCCASGGPLGSWRQTDGISPVALPWPSRTAEGYDVACSACEHVVLVQTQHQLRELVALLRFDKRRGAHGRALLADFEVLGLKKGWRLEVGHSCSDIGMVDTLIDDFPVDGVRLLFWDCSKETFCRRRNPLLSSRTTLTIADLVPDELHTLHLGVFQDYVLTVFWDLLLANAFMVEHDGNEETLLENGALHLRYELNQWCKKEKVNHPERPLEEIRDFHRSSIGQKDRRVLRAKGAESGTLLYFAVDLIRQKSAAIPTGGHLLAAGRALVEYLTITRKFGWRLPAREHQSLMNACVRYTVLLEPAGTPWKPKVHLFVHLAFNTGQYGNPRMLSTWQDESLNMELAKVCSKAHAAVWSRRVVSTFAHALGPISSFSSHLRKKPRR